jgi:NADH-quinone oxidoreductase subunit H
MLFIYEVPFFLALMMPTLMAGTWSVSEIVAWQQEHLWLALLQPIAFVIALIGLQAKLERTPFDIPEAETEIVAGPWTELTGRRLALMHLANQCAAVAGSALIAAVFLGGPSLPWTIAPPVLGAAAGFLLFLAKTLAILLVLAIVRGATARFRLDQMNVIGWKYITTAALAQVAIVLAMNAWWVRG